ncbi:hypothetical protein V5J35_000841 [Endozoicomonas sp. NE40]|uniref:Uncharacterized protein n=1 Tax=Endozoicomonas lisbonensis TaxID=3120522 RepID=A0ABV2SD00_9GAMM
MSTYDTHSVIHESQCDTDEDRLSNAAYRQEISHYHCLISHCKGYQVGRHLTLGSAAAEGGRVEGRSPGTNWNHLLGALATPLLILGTGLEPTPPSICCGLSAMHC